MTDSVTGAHVAGDQSSHSHNGGDALTGGRRTAYTITRGLTALFVLGVVVAFFLAGLGTFGLKGRISDDSATGSFDPHRGVGSLLTLISLFILIGALVARPGGRIRWLALGLFGLMVGQNILAAAGKSVHVLGAFHALNGLLILGVAGLLAVETGALRRGR